MEKNIDCHTDEPAGIRGEFYISFDISGLRLAVAYCGVREIIAYSAPVPVPQAPSYIKGIINYCGRICLIISINSIIGFPDADISRKTRIIMLESAENPSIQIGIIADMSMGCSWIRQDQIIPGIGPIKGLNPDCIAGTARINDTKVAVFYPFMLFKELDYISTK